MTHPLTDSDSNNNECNPTLTIDPDGFLTTIEVVPPLGADPRALLDSLNALKTLPFDGFSVATNPVAKARMCAMSFCVLIQEKIGKPAILHCTTRDHNRISLQAMLWGAKALGLGTVMAATGDFVAMDQRKKVSDVKDLDVFELIEMASTSGMQTGAVFDFRPESDGLEREVERLEKKAAAGASFVVTQPVYDREMARTLSISTSHIDIPVIMGILPLRTPKHARFLDQKVAGIAVPAHLIEIMDQAKNPIAEGVANAREMLLLAREFFKGACIMPPFDHFEVMPDILKKETK